MEAPGTTDVIQVIGITGTIGAGKGTAVEQLMQPPHNFVHYSARTLLNEMVAEQGLPPGRDSLREVANAMRLKHGPAAVIEALFAKARAVGKDAIIESVRTEGEVLALRESGFPFTLLAVDADQRLRYDRVTTRGSSTDSVSFEKFRAQEATEMASAQAHEQNLARCMALADATLLNNGTQTEFRACVNDFALRLRGGGGGRRGGRSQLLAVVIVSGVLTIAGAVWYQSRRSRASSRAKKSST